MKAFRSMRARVSPPMMRAGTVSGTSCAHNRRSGRRIKPVTMAIALIMVKPGWLFLSGYTQLCHAALVEMVADELLRDFQGTCGGFGRHLEHRVVHNSLQDGPQPSGAELELYRFIDNVFQRFVVERQSDIIQFEQLCVLPDQGI